MRRAADLSIGRPSCVLRWRSAARRKLDFGVLERVFEHWDARRVAVLAFVRGEARIDVLIVRTAVPAAAALGQILLILAGKRMAVGHVVALRRHWRSECQDKTGHKAAALYFHGSLLSIEEVGRSMSDAKRGFALRNACRAGTPTLRLDRARFNKNTLTIG
jgi:hypothetical protein